MNNEKEDEMGNLNEHLIGRIQRSVEADTGLDVTAAEVRTVYSGEWAEARTAEARAIRQALSEYGFKSAGSSG